MKTARELIEFCVSKIGCGYVFGSGGQTITEAFLQAKAKQYPQQYSAAYLQRSRRWIGHVAYDCSGLIDACLGVDYSAQGYYANATDKGRITSMPDTIGVLVFIMDLAGHVNHVGVYIGNDKAIEARGVDFGVVETTVSQRTWTHWGKCHLVDYTQGEEDMLQKGDKGQAVYDLQTAFQRLGYSIGSFKNMLNPTILDGRDGDFGDTMVRCVKLLQGRHNLPLTGIVDAVTYGKLAIDLAAIPSGAGITQTQLDDVNAKLSGAVAALELANASVGASNAIIATANANIETLKQQLQDSISTAIGWQSHSEEQKKLLTAVEQAMDTLNAVRGG